jgi:pyruvate,water dikinase
VDRWITDYPPSARYPVYTRANAGEVLPDPCSPLGQTLVWDPGVVAGWCDSQVRVGTFAEHEIEPWECVGFFGGYLYVNVSTARIFGERAPGLSASIVDRTYFGEHPDVPPYEPEPWHESAASTEKLTAWIGGVLLADDLPILRAERDEADAARASRPDLGALADHELVARARSFVPLIRRLFDRHLAQTGAASIGPGILQQVTAAIGEPGLALTLISAVDDVDSAAPSYALWTLSREVLASDELMAVFDHGVDGLLDRLRASDSQVCHDFAHELTRFTVRFGSRGPNEWDIRSQTWETAPELALALVDRMRLTPEADSPEARGQKLAAEREAATARITAALASDEATLTQLQLALRSAHLHLAGRERTKTNIIKVIHEVRMAVRELGTRHGYDHETICMLLADELDAFTADPGALRARLASRAQQYRSLFDLDPPFIVNREVPSLETWSHRSPTRRIPDGVTVTVDGDAGTVTLH